MIDTDFDTLLARLAAPTAGRRIVAIVGAPGSGKSTLADRLVAALDARAPGRAAVLPMDGFHYDDAVLEALGRHARKGAPDTFDAAGLGHALGRLAARDEAHVAVPLFDRSIEVARAGARLIPRSADIVLVEGNYLLLDDEPWRGLRRHFDLSVYVDVPLEVLHARLTRRWTDLRMPADVVRVRVEGNDMPNARLVIDRGAVADCRIAFDD